jgi:hypothetical protein
MVMAQSNGNPKRSGPIRKCPLASRSMPVPAMLTYLVLLFSIVLGLAAPAASESSHQDEVHIQPHKVIAQLQQLRISNAFGHPLAPRAAVTEDDKTPANESPRKKSRRCTLDKLKRKCSVCRRQIRSQARSAACHTVQSLKLDMYSEGNDLKNSWSCFTAFDQCARRRLLFRRCGTIGRMAYKACKVGKLPLPDDMVEPPPERVDTCTDLPMEEYEESFEVYLEVKCRANGNRPVKPSDELNGVFEHFFQKQEDCGVFDDGEFDGCGVGWNVLSADVVDVVEGPCYDSVDGEQNNRRASTAKKVKKRRRKVKFKGRTRKSGRCRGNCANRNSKVDDSITSPNQRTRNLLRRQFHQDVVANRQQDPSARSLEDTYGICSPDATEEDLRPPDLISMLQEEKDNIGFVAVKGETIIETFECFKESKHCNNGSHKCCGYPECSCAAGDATPENCRLGTTSDNNSNKVCELFADGVGDANDPSSNLCCALQPTIDECADTCNSCTEECDLEFSTSLSPGDTTRSVNLNVRINNRCSKDVTLTRLRLNTCAMTSPLPMVASPLNRLLVLTFP